MKFLRIIETPASGHLEFSGDAGRSGQKNLLHFVRVWLVESVAACRAPFWQPFHFILFSCLKIIFL